MQCGIPGFDPWIGKIPWREEWLPTPVFLPGEFHGQKSLVGYSPWGHKRDTNEQLSRSLGVVVVIFWSLCIFCPEFAPIVQAHRYF